MTSTPTKNDIPTASAAGLIADMAKAAATPRAVAIDTTTLGPGLPVTIPAFWDGDKQQIVSVYGEVEKFRQDPQRRTGTAKVDTLASFIDLVNRHKTEHSVIFAATGWPDPKLTAVIDYHGANREPGWLRHKVVYPFPLTDEFKAWAARDGQPMKQLDFAEFLEEHAAELAAPLPAEIAEYEPKFRARFANPNELIDLSRHLEVFVGAKIKQQHRLQTGEKQITFDVEHLNVSGEPIDIPGIFILNVRPFVDGDVARIPARIRYRAGADVVWFFDLYRWEQALRDRAHNDMLRARNETALPAFEGAPEST